MNAPQYLPKIGSGFLPPDAVRRLKEVAATENPPEDPTARIRAINEADLWVRSVYPQYFRKV